MRVVVAAATIFGSTIQDSLTAYKSVEICIIFYFFESLMVFKSAEICRFLCI
jgi:hypothetical protein